VGLNERVHVFGYWSSGKKGVSVVATRCCGTLLQPQTTHILAETNNSPTNALPHDHGPHLDNKMKENE
jgi:hypothetical protein